MRHIVLAIVLAAGLLAAWTALVRSASPGLLPRGQHCGDTGPIGDPEYCGCTWGEVIYHGQPVAGAEITLTFDGQTSQDVAAVRITDEPPHYGLTAHELGAKRGDIITLTARFAGEVVTRTFAAEPDDDGEQHIVLAFPERSAFVSSLPGGYTRTLAIANGVVWAGGPEGLAAVELATGAVATQTLPWQQGGVEVLAARDGGEIWSATGSSLARLSSGAWEAVGTPAGLGSIRALAVDPLSGQLWAGGAASSRATLARYDGSWHSEQLSKDPPEAITALVVDGRGTVWAGTWGSGLYKRRDDGGWTRYRDIDGLATNRVLALAADDDFVWAGGDHYVSGMGQHGGISRFDLDLGTWQNYGVAEGLPAAAVSLRPGAPAPVLALAVDSAGKPWAGTAKGVYSLLAPGWWTQYSGMDGAGLGAIPAVTAADVVFAAGLTGVSRLAEPIIPGTPPTASISASSVSTVTRGFGSTFVLEGSGTDADEGGQTVLGWEWLSDRDGPLCTRATCDLEIDALSLGTHLLSLAVLDDEGEWSPPQTIHLTVVPAVRTYLPALTRGAQAR